MNQKLAEFLSKKQKAAEVIDWDERRNAYLQAVQDLYRQIQTLLADPLELGTVKFRLVPKQLSENYIGSYSVDDLVLVIGGEQVRFSPQGRNIVGALGRVDVVGERGEAVLILTPASGWGWVQSRQPRQVEPFSEPILADIFKLVMRD